MCDSSAGADTLIVVKKVNPHIYLNVMVALLFCRKVGLIRICYTKQIMLATTKKPKLAVSSFEELKPQFLMDTKAVVPWKISLTIW